MAKLDNFRRYLVVNVDKELLGGEHSAPLQALVEAYAAQNFNEIAVRTRELFASVWGPQLLGDDEFQISSAPSTRFTLSEVVEGEEAPKKSDLDPAQRVLAIQFAKSETLVRLIEFFRQRAKEDHRESRRPIFQLRVAADPVAHGTSEEVLPRVSHLDAFGTRRRARDLIGAHELASRGLTGKGVNVIIVDRGLNRSALERQWPGCWGGGLDITFPAGADTDKLIVEAGAAPVRSHGMMIARNVLDLAPHAKVYDVPLLPPLIGQASIFASTANATYHAIRKMIGELTHTQQDRWVVVNAWAIFDRSTEFPPEDYTRNKQEGLAVGLDGGVSIALGHPLNEIVGELARGKDGLPPIDIVFGAGNCGQFASPRRCGEIDRGPGCSIWGANSHPDVYTVAAVTVEGAWLGYSSQGPAAWPKQSDMTPANWQERFAEKPDFAAPSQFYDDGDRATLNSGTSAAAAVAAGVIAAVRSAPALAGLPPTEMKEMIRRSSSGKGWNGRTGCGTLRIPALCRELEQAGHMPLPRDQA